MKSKRTYAIYSSATNQYYGDVLAPDAKEARRMGMIKYGFNSQKGCYAILK